MAAFDPTRASCCGENNAPRLLKKTSKQYLYGDEEDDMHDENNDNTSGTTRNIDISRNDEKCSGIYGKIETGVTTSAAYGTFSALS